MDFPWIADHAFVGNGNAEAIHDGVVHLFRRDANITAIACKSRQRVANLSIVYMLRRFAEWLAGHSCHEAGLAPQALEPIFEKDFAVVSSWHFSEVAPIAFNGCSRFQSGLDHACGGDAVGISR